MLFLRRLGTFTVIIAAVVLAAGRGAADQAAAPDPVEGCWLGTVTSPDGDRVPLGFRFFRLKDGRLAAALHLPAMNVADSLVSLVQVTDTGYALDNLPATASLGIGRLIGSFAFAKMPFAMKRVEKFPAFTPAATPDGLPAGPAPVWSRPLGAAAWASPVVREGMIYLGTTDGRLHAVRADTGAELWTWSSPTPLYGTALATADALFFLTARHELVRLNRTDGREVWKLALDPAAAKSEKISDPSFNHRTPVPVLAAGVLYVGAGDGVMRALDPANGRERWRFDAQGRIFATATVTSDRVYFGTLDSAVFALDRATGRPVWRAKTRAGISSAPVIVGDTVAVGGRDYLMHGLAVADGEERWLRHFWFSWVESTPSVADGLLCVGSSDFRCVRALDPATGEPRWDTDVFGCSWGTPLIAGDTIYAGTSGQNGVLIKHDAALVALDRATGALRWRTPLAHAADAPIFGYVNSLAAADHLLVAASVDGTLAAYPLP